MARRFVNIISMPIVIVAGAVTGWFWLTMTRGPELVVSDIDLGTYTSAHTLERALRLQNRGPGELVIDNAATCCGISQVGDLPKRIPPKSSDVIVFRIKPEASPFPYEKSFALHTNDSRKPVKKVFVRGTPDMPVYVSPGSIDLKHVVAGEQLSEAALILIADNKQATFSVVTSSPNIQASPPRRVPRKRLGNRVYDRFAVDVRVDKEAPRGPLHEYIFLKTGIADRSYVVVPVRGMVECGLRVRPKQVFFGMVASEAIVRRIIRVEVIGPGWDSIRIGPSNSPGIAAKLQQKSEKKFELHVSLDPVRMPDKLKSKLTLQNSSGDTIQIPVLAMRKTL